MEDYLVSSDTILVDFPKDYDPRAFYGWDGCDPVKMSVEGLIFPSCYHANWRGRTLFRLYQIRPGTLQAGDFLTLIVSYRAKDPVPTEGSLRASFYLFGDGGWVTDNAFAHLWDMQKQVITPTIETYEKVDLLRVQVRPIDAQKLTPIAYDVASNGGWVHLLVSTSTPLVLTRLLLIKNGGSN